MTASWMQHWARPGRTTSRDIRLDLLWLLCAMLVLVASGVGLRDPWPADEPRFVLVAREMSASGDWLIPRIAGELYAEKPPLYFWLMALALKVTGSTRVGFLLPSLLSSTACVLLVYDLARRLWNRETGLIAATALLFTVQFFWQARQAQIDATLCFWTTLSLYGLLRDALERPSLKWFALGWAAAGFGVITKGVGFLPLLILPVLAALRLRWSQEMSFDVRIRRARWIVGPAAFLGAIGCWLLPMWIVSQSDPALAAYRDHILLQQTVERYANAWHHREPFWYFIVQVIPVLWLPWIALLPWLVPQWRAALRAHDLRIGALLWWAFVVVIFFSASSGKRGVYVLPAVPAFVLACAPYFRELLSKASVQRVLFGIACVAAIACAAAFVYLSLRPDLSAELIANYGLDATAPSIVIALSVVAVCLLARPSRGVLAYAGTATVVLLIISYWLNPMLDPARSSVQFVARVEQKTDVSRELGWVEFKEQYLLNLTRPIVPFGRASALESDQSIFDAARWLHEAPGRQLIVNDETRERCFSHAQLEPLGLANRTSWFLVFSGADPDCIARGRPNAARTYVPPRTH